MSGAVRSKLIQYYGVGVPHGERPSSVPPIQITQDEIAVVNVAANPGGINITVVQDEIAVVEVVANVGTVEVAGFPQNIIGDIAVVEVIGNPGAFSLPNVIVQNNVAVVEVVGNPGAVSVPSVGGSEIVQHTPADAIVIGQLGAMSQLLAQNQPARVEVRPRLGTVTVGHMISQTRPAVVHVVANSGKVNQPFSQQKPAEVVVQAQSGSVVIGQEIAQNELAAVNVQANLGSFILGLAVSQVTPATVEVQAGVGFFDLAPSQPQAIVQVSTAVVEVQGRPGEQFYTGGIPVGTWTGPHECLDPFGTAVEILFKTPAESLWVSFQFDFDLQYDITDATATTTATGITIGPISIGGVNGEKNQIRYEVSGGVDGQNVRIHHEITITDPVSPTRYGDGFLYIRENV